MRSLTAFSAAPWPYATGVRTFLELAKVSSTNRKEPNRKDAPSTQPPLQVFGDEVVIIQVRVTGVKALDLFELSGR